jgi:hypothetical protein
VHFVAADNLTVPAITYEVRVGGALVARAVHSSDVHFVEAGNLTVLAITYEVGADAALIGLQGCGSVL